MKNVPINTSAVIAVRSASDSPLNIKTVVYQKRAAGTDFLLNARVDRFLPKTMGKAKA
jgi:hypothetical protein